MKNTGKKPINKKTKILAIGDIHGNTGLARKLADRAVKENVDVVILAGDITFAEMSLEGIIGPFAKAKKDILLLSGNHESFSTTNFLSELYKPYAKNLDGYSFIKNDVGIFGSGGVVNMGMHAISDSTLFEMISNAHKSVKGMKKKIMVTHMHPAGSKAEKFGFEGAKSITKAIHKFQPDILITAHIHEASGMEETIGSTKVINVSKKEIIFEI